MNKFKLGGGNEGGEREGEYYTYPNGMKNLETKNSVPYRRKV